MKRIFLFVLYIALAFLWGCIGQQPSPSLHPSPSPQPSPSSSTPVKELEFAVTYGPDTFDSEEELFAAVKQAREDHEGNPLGRLEFYPASKNPPQGFELGGFSIKPGAYITVYYVPTEPQEGYKNAFIRWQINSPPLVSQNDVEIEGIQKHNDIYYIIVQNEGQDARIQGYYVNNGLSLFASASGDMTIEQFEAFCQIEKIMVE